MADGAGIGSASTVVTAGFNEAMRRCLAGPFNGTSPPHFFTALSGGPDSTALACLTQDFAARHGLRHTALIVDHRIRDASTAEAHRVATRMRGHGVRAEILTVADDAPSAGVQAWARDRRYDLMLARVRRERGCLLLGHHGGDQAETVMMRLSRGSGIAGLAAMRPVSQRAGVIILRPLLGMSAETLIDHCHACDVDFERDPSNLDRRYERVRVRGALAALDAIGTATPDQLRRLAGAAAIIDDMLLRALAASGYLPTAQPSGHMVLPATVADLPPAIASRLLTHVIAQVARPPVPPSVRSLRQLALRLALGRPATLAGTRFTRQGDDWLVTAELGRRPPCRPVPAGERVIFAGVWEIASPVDATIRHLGVAGSGATHGWTERPGWCALPSLVRRSMPVLETLDGALIYPHLQSTDSCDGPAVKATARFLPLQTYRD